MAGKDTGSDKSKKTSTGSSSTDSPTSDENSEKFDRQLLEIKEDLAFIKVTVIKLRERTKSTEHRSEPVTSSFVQSKSDKHIVDIKRIIERYEIDRESRLTMRLERIEEDITLVFKLVCVAMLVMGVVVFWTMWMKQKAEFPVHATTLPTNQTNFDYYDKDEDQLGALVYIVVIIGIFATSVMVFVCRYISNVSSDEDTNKLMGKLMRQLEEGFDPRRKLTGKLALSALNIANKCVVEDTSLQRLTFV